MKVLMLEDNVNDLNIIQQLLRKHYSDVTFYCVELENEFRDEILKGYDIIISDYSMPYFSGFDALNVRNEMAPQIPFIIVTGSVNELTAVDCLKAGADNYILKEHLKRLVPAIDKALLDKKNELDKFIAEKKLVDIVNRYNALVVQSDLGVIIDYFENKPVYLNDFAKLLLGVENEDSFDVQSHILNLIHLERNDLLNEFQIKNSLEFEFRLKNNAVDKWLNLHIEPYVEMGQILGFQYVLKDITGVKKEALVVEAINRLARKALVGSSFYDFLAYSYEITRNFINTNNYFVALYNPLKNNYSFPFYHDEKDEIVGFTEMDLEGGLTDLVRKTGETLWLEKSDILRYIENGKLKALGSLSEVWMGVPLVDNNEVIGVIGLQDYYNKNALSADDVIFLERFAPWVTMKVKQEKVFFELAAREKRFYNLFRESPLAIVVHQDGIIKMANPTAHRIANIQGGDSLIGQSVLKFVDASFLETVKKRIDKIINHKEPQAPIIEKLVTNNGSFIYVEVTAIPFEYDQRPASQVIMRDVTAEFLAKQQLKDSEEKFRMGFKTSPDAMAIINLNSFCAIESNASFELLMGFAIDQCPAKNWIEHIFVTEEKRSKFISNVIDIGEVSNMDIEIFNPKLGQHYVLLSAIKLVLQGEDHVMLILKDISEMKEIQAKLETAMVKAEESDKLKSAFLANMSHEIRTPMNHIVGFTEILRQSITDEDLQSYIQIIQRSSSHLLELISDIIDISKVEAGQLKMDFKEINPSIVLKELNDSFKYDQRLIDKPNLQLRVQTVLNPSIKIWGDRTRLMQVLINLVTNALKFTSHGFVDVSYDIIEQKYVRFCVKDTGCGILPDQLNVIFQRFRQASNTIKVSNEGTGLGLALSKAYVELMGGSIWVDSIVNEGSSFYFTVPLHSHAQSLSNEFLAFSNLKIALLVKDKTDEFLLGTFLKGLFSQNQFHAIRNIDDFDAFNSEKFDLAFVSLGNSSSDSIAVFRNIKSKFPSIQLIGLSDYSRHAADQNLEDIGFYDFLVKPLSREKVNATISRFLMEKGY